MNQKKIENKFYAAAPGMKARFATMNEVEQRYRTLLRRVQNGENEQGGIQWLGDIKDAIQNQTESPEVLMAEIKDVERRMGFAASGTKTAMARNSEFDTDEVKNLLHKKSRDAEWGIDREVKGRGVYTYSAYHAYVGEPVFTKRFNTRGEAEKWLEKQNAAGHPNKRKHARPGAKVKFAWTPGAARERNYVLDVARRFDMDCAEKIATLKKALASVRDLRAIIAKTENIDELDSTRDKMYSIMRDAKMEFARPGAKDKFDNPVDLEMLWKRQPNGDWSAVLWDVKAKKVARTVRTFKTEREAKDFVNAWWQKNR